MRFESSKQMLPLLIAALAAQACSSRPREFSPTLQAARTDHAAYLVAAVGATIIAAPVVAVVGAWGLAKSKKLKKEKAVQQATAQCLGERGYQVADWVRASKR